MINFIIDIYLLKKIKCCHVYVIFFLNLIVIIATVDRFLVGEVVFVHCGDCYPCKHFESYKTNFIII